MPKLNLLNFEIPQNRSCKYILTSPRSLKACRIAGIKPLELLYKSLSEVEKEIGKGENAQEKYQAYEKERQRKLALCRKLRNDLMLGGLSEISDINKKETKLDLSSGNEANINSRNIEIKDSDSKSNSEESIEHLKKLDKITENLSNTVPCQEILENENNTIKTVQANQIINQNSPSKSPSSTEKSTCESIPLLEKTAQTVKLKSKINSSILVPDKSLDNLNGEKSIEKEESPKNLFKRENIENNEYYQHREKLPLLDLDRKIVHFEDINNNNHIEKLEKYLDKKLSSSYRKKIREKKKLKALEYDRLYHDILAQYSDPEYCLFKYRQVIENSLDRELREQEVHRVQRELEEGLERWQDDVLLIQWLDSLRAQQQSAKELERKVERLQRNARSKNILHTMNYNKVKKDEDIKMELLRRFIENKEKRILKLHKQRERVIYESKARAQNISELKQQIRDIMTPETFDQTVLKCGLQRKILNARIVGPKNMQKSHIRLA
ncbi:hypothetical protein O3M35_009444 [Rhynocoris fuscipes]|uniref:Uncharacterized protein n=1 Tax=Rhynocoris fuscipes TaxID=488301 RepID=A0AAW1D5U9_9HEMI